jgi:hypothetical protein
MLTYPLLTNDDESVRKVHDWDQLAEQRSLARLLGILSSVISPRQRRAAASSEMHSEGRKDLFLPFSEEGWLRSVWPSLGRGGSGLTSALIHHRVLQASIRITCRRMGSLYRGITFCTTYIPIRHTVPSMSYLSCDGPCILLSSLPIFHPNGYKTWIRHS